MKQFLVGAAMVSLLSACSGGNPFESTETSGEDGSETTGGQFGIPTEVAGDMASFSYDPVNQTLTITGVSLDAEPITGTYQRNPTLDRAGYEAYSTQESSLDRFSQAFVKEANGTRAAVAVTGGQFGYYFGGTSYGRDGAFSPPSSTPTTGMVSYAGDYVGLTNLQIRDGEILPITSGTPTDLTTGRPTSVTGVILVNADFGDNVVNGGITDRRLGDAGTAIDALELAPTSITADGTFQGDVTQVQQGVGQYGGVFGGAGASAVAGSLFVTDHMGNLTGLEGEEEYGIFVLVQCGTAGDDDLCDQPVP